MGHKTSKPAKTEKILAKGDKLRVLLNHVSFSLNFNLEKSYLNAPEFKLEPKGGKLTQLTKPVKWNKKSIYIGECSGNEMNGLGFLITEKGWFYEGFFIKNKYHGIGRLFTNTGSIIVGEWVKNEISKGKILNFHKKTFEGELKNLEPNGSGSETSEGYTYAGQFLNGKKHGNGKVEWKDGTWYEGGFANGKIEGLGKYHWLDSEYDGQWKAGKMHGQGKYIWNDGRKYEGSLVAGQREGYGVYIEGNKKYSGYWRAGKEDGQGKLEENGQVSEGIWIYGKLNKSFISNNSVEKVSKNVDLSKVKVPEKIREKCKNVIEIWEKLKKFEWDSGSCHISDRWAQVGKGVYYGEVDGDNIPHGKGIFISSSTLFEGHFNTGEKEGYGRSVNIQGEVYNGDWVNSKKSGFGVLNKEDSIYVGEWANDKFSGMGKLEAPTFKYDGNWEKGLQHGKGTMENPDNTIFIGDFVNGVVSGEGVLKYPNGKCIKGHWENGKVLKVTKKYYEESESEEESEVDILDLRNLKEMRKLLNCQELN